MFNLTDEETRESLYFIFLDQEPTLTTGEGYRCYCLLFAEEYKALI